MAPPTSSSDGAEEERDERAIDDESEDEAPPRGFFISALDANNDGVVTADQIVTNMSSIFLSWVDWGLHVAFAVWLYYRLPGTLYSDLAIAALAIAVFVNLVAIVRYVLRHTADADSSLRERLMEYPENSTLVLVLGTINVEVLIFLSDQMTDHANFRSLGLLTHIFEGVPMLAIQLALVNLELGFWPPLVIVSFAFTALALGLKLLRAWVTHLTVHIENDEPELLIGENLTADDVLASAGAVVSFCLSVTQLVWLHGAATRPGVDGTPLGAQLRAAFAAILASLLALGAGNFALLTRYLRRDTWAHSLLWRESFASSAYAFVSLFHAGAINAFTQDDKQYHETKAQGTAAWLLLYALPCGGVHLAVGLWLGCAEHACAGGTAKAAGAGMASTGALPPVAFASIAPCAFLLPLALFNGCRLVVARSTARGAQEEGGLFLYDDEDEQLSSKPVRASERLPIAASLCASFLAVGLRVTAAEYLRTRHVLGIAAGAVGAGARALDGAGAYALDARAPLGALQTPRAFAIVAYALIGASSLFNWAAAAHYLLRRASVSLRSTLFALPGTSALVLAASCATGEVLAALARERSDLDAARILSAVGLLTQDAPFLALLGLRATYWADGADGAIIALPLALTAAVLALKGARALVVGLASAHAAVPCRAPSAFLALVRRGDALSWAVTLAHWLCSALLAVALGSHALSAAAAARAPRGLDVGGGGALPALSVAASRSFVAAAAILSTSALANVALAASFLNHRLFTCAHVCEHSYASAAILLGTMVDGSALNCLAQDARAYLAVKRDALALHVAVCGMPMLALTAALKYVHGSALGSHIADAAAAADGARGVGARARADDGGSRLGLAAPLLIDLTLALSAAVVVWRVYLWAILTVTWRGALRAAAASASGGERRGGHRAAQLELATDDLAAEPLGAAATDDDEEAEEEKGARARNGVPRSAFLFTTHRATTLPPSASDAATGGPTRTSARALLAPPSGGASDCSASASGASGARSVRPPRTFVHALPCTRQWRLNRYGSNRYGSAHAPSAPAARAGGAASEGDGDDDDDEGGTVGGKVAQRDELRVDEPTPPQRARRALAARDTLEEASTVAAADGAAPAARAAVAVLQEAEEEGIGNGIFEHTALLPARAARCARGRALAGWTQLDGEGGIAGAPEVVPPSGGNAWRLSVTGLSAGARAAVGQAFRTTAGERYSLVCSVAGVDTDETSARALSVQLTGGGLNAAGSAGERLASRRILVPNSAVIERAGWKSARVDFAATGPLTTALFIARTPASTLYVADVRCERVDGGGGDGGGGAAQAATPSGGGGGAAVQTREQTLDADAQTAAAAAAGDRAGGAPPPAPPGAPSGGGGGGGGFFEGLSSMLTAAMTPRGALSHAEPPPSQPAPQLDEAGADGVARVTPGAGAGARTGGPAAPLVSGGHRPPPPVPVPQPPTSTPVGTATATTPATRGAANGAESGAEFSVSSDGSGSRADALGGGGGSGSGGGTGRKARSPRSMFGMGGFASLLGGGGEARADKGGRKDGRAERAERGTVAGDGGAELGAEVRATVETTADAKQLATAVTKIPAECVFVNSAGVQGILVSSATLPRVGGGAPPYFFLQAIALRDDGGDARATSRGAQERPSTKQLTYSVAEARGMSPEQLARAASREPEEASAALTRYAARRQQSRMA